MMLEYVAIFSLALLSGMSTLIGVALAILLKRNLKAIIVSIGFAAGIMLLISFFELIPESIRVGGVNSLISLALGLLLFTTLNFTISHTHIEEEKRMYLSKTAYLATLGLILHDLPEGFSIANSYISSQPLGILIAICVAAHNIPEEFVIAAPLTLVERRSFLFKAAFFSALAEPLGALMGIFAVHLFAALNPYLMSFAAGAMIFVATHEILPLAFKYRRTDFFLLGIFLSSLVYLGLTTLL